MVKRFSAEQKKTAVDRYFEEGGNAPASVKAPGCPSVTALLQRVRKYPRCARRSFDEKMLAAVAYLGGTAAPGSAAQPAGPDASRAARWVKKCLKEGPSCGGYSRRGPRSTGSQDRTRRFSPRTSTRCPDPHSAGCRLSISPAISCRKSFRRDCRWKNASDRYGLEILRPRERRHQRVSVRRLRRPEAPRPSCTRAQERPSRRIRRPA